MIARALTCPNCGGPTRFRVPFCAYCRFSLTWSRVPELERGAPLLVDRYPSMPLLGASLLGPKGIDARADGHLVTLRAQSGRWAFSNVKSRDAAALVSATTHERAGAFGTVARAHAEGKLLDAYIALVAPGYRSVRLSRLIEGGDVSQVLVLEDWTCSPHVRPVGERNEIELRCADTILQLYVNGERIFSIEDAGIGFGAYGWRTVSLANPHDTSAAHITIHGVEVHEVKA